MKFDSITVVISVALLSACATSPPSAAEVRPASPDRLVAFQTKQSGEQATLVITRDVGMMSKMCLMGVSINGTFAARLAPGESMTAYVPSGEVMLRAGRDPTPTGLCGYGPEEWTQRETVVRVGEVKTFRLSIDANGKKDIQRAD